jgi:hypothetical protein
MGTTRTRVSSIRRDSEGDNKETTRTTRKTITTNQKELINGRPK